jgi:hypothetical protein
VMHTVYPSVLADRGLGGAVEALALDLAVPVTVTVDRPGQAAFGSPLWTGIVIAVLVWLVSVAGAVRLGERPGPAEKVLRRLTYGG